MITTKYIKQIDFEKTVHIAFPDNNRSYKVTVSDICRFTGLNQRTVGRYIDLSKSFKRKSYIMQQIVDAIKAIAKSKQLEYAELANL